MLARRRRRAWPAAGTTRPRRGRWIVMAAALAAACGAGAARGTGTDRAILAAAQRFVPFCPGVLAPIALTAAVAAGLLAAGLVAAGLVAAGLVAAGLVAAGRIVMTPAGRVTSQAVHRALSRQAALRGDVRGGAEARLCRSPRPRFSGSGSRA